MHAHKPVVACLLVWLGSLTMDGVSLPAIPSEQIRKRTMEKVRAAYKLFVSDRGNDTMRKARLEVFTMYDPNW